MRRFAILFLAVLLVLAAGGCSNKNVHNPIAGLDSKQPDKVLFDRAMEAMKANKFDVARLTLQTLINTYPDSEFVARAKLAVADSWYAQGGSAALAQAELEYKDFITFFPNMPEAAEAQLKVANIHYQQMEKPDRDYTHAKRAEDEYRQLILQFPDSPLVEDAKMRLLEVQEVLAEREFRIGRFYYMRQSWAAAIARLKSLVDAYPLYSGVDEALYMLGDAYEEQIQAVRNSRLPEVTKGRMLREFTNKAADAYTRIVTRYPVMNRAEDAKERLRELDREVPEPTAEAIARNQREEESRAEMGTISRFMLNFRKRPNVARAVKVGEPTLRDPEPTSAPEIVRSTAAAMLQREAPTGTVSVETVGKDERVLESDPVPRSEEKPVPPPHQVNEAAQPDAQSAPENVNRDNASSSKEKKKKGLRKLIPF